jgi:hypothetical protein
MRAPSILYAFTLIVEDGKTACLYLARSLGLAKFASLRGAGLHSIVSRN